MCNARNHRPGCTCGWGGAGHLGRRSGSSTENNARVVYSWIPPISRSIESYVNPNSKCPVCGASVFFYQSPHGGRVFFDELGPPWPKHPCTDSSSVPRRILVSEVKTSKRLYDWQREKWVPFYINSIKKIELYILQVEGETGRDNKVLYIELTTELANKVQQIRSGTIAQIRNPNSSRPEISIATYKGHWFTEIAYTSIAELRSKLLRMQSSHVRPKKRKAKNATPKAAKNTAMAQAFEKAKSNK